MRGRLRPGAAKFPVMRRHGMRAAQTIDGEQSYPNPLARRWCPSRTYVEAVLKWVISSSPINSRTRLRADLTLPWWWV